MNWCAQQRQSFIAEMLDVYGFINRAHLERKFGCSSIQASKDLTLFAARNPAAVRYDNRAKAYMAPDAASKISFRTLGQPNLPPVAGSPTSPPPPKPTR
ncbi:MAG: hypothetical protein ACPGSI_16610 [Pikeienuella sp.]